MADSEHGKYRCDTCKGTGRDPTAPKLTSGYIACRDCFGNGLDNAKLFRWGAHPPLTTKETQ